MGARVALIQLRHGAAKRRAEEEAEATSAAAPLQSHSSTGRDVSAVSRKRIAIALLPGVVPPPAGVSLGCHLARRAGAGPGGGGGGSGSGGGAGSSLARVYGGKLRTSQLPEDYVECFAGLAPEPRLDPNMELDDGVLGSPGPQRRHRIGRGGVGAEALAAASAAAAGEAPLGSVGVGSDMPFLLSSAASLQAQPQAAANGVGVGFDPGLVGASPGGLLAPFLPGDAAAAAAVAALGGLPFGAGLAGVAAGGAAGGASGSVAGLMLDEEEDDSDGDGDDDEDGDGDGDAQMAFDELDAPGGTQGFGEDAFMAYDGVGQGAVVGGADGAAGDAAEGDGAMVEEF
ncbi:hypothetical protein GPECTOR_6g607 [Gonium pectorale]|uniref:Uncharacterized protein n=1 Tax=Gonium pectorale TaxID=33097 RepID=A0A150GWD7_GONPE|nr:hypothetical protein GPECTOR_6g607 [Gonium pectorale]|eukprot:KXZ53690.1 hypothetical protein GPECTOR_6g607 [Gonium pectorale]